MISPALLKTFNQSDTVIFISKYPYKQVAASHHGVATYTKHLISSLVTTTHTRFVIFVQAEYHRPVWHKDNVLVVPVYSGVTSLFTNLLPLLARFSQVNLVHVHSEFLTSGKPLQMAAVLPFFLAIKLLGKQVYYTAHNVIDNFDFIAAHLGRKRTDVLLRLLEWCMPAYYFVLSHLVEKVIVLDESVVARLKRYVSTSKLYLSPHWVKQAVLTPQQRRVGRQHYGMNASDFVIVCFGFMTHYKGVDWLANCIQELPLIQGKHIRLVLAGGRAPSQIGKAHYEQFYTKLTQNVAQSRSLVLTDFIPEADVPRYFALADLVILPYRGILGASGSLAQALAYGKPFLLSKELSAYLHETDVQQALQAEGLTANDVLFVRTKPGLLRALRAVIASPKKRRQLQHLSTALAAKRSPSIRLQTELDDLYTPQSSWVSLQLARVKQKILFTIA